MEGSGGGNSPDVPGIGLANLTINPTSPGRRDPIPWKFQYSFDDVMVFWWVSFRVAEHKDEQTKGPAGLPGRPPVDSL
jgi:hypothetical protein